MNLKRIKEAKNLTNKSLSELTGVPTRTIEDIIKRNDCRVSTAIRIAKALDVTLDELCIEEPTNE